MEFWNVLGAALGAFALIITAWAKLRESHTQGEGTALSGYQGLAKDMREEIDRMKETIASQQCRLDALEAENAQLRQENNDLICRIGAVETKLADRERRLAELQACSNGGGE